MPYLKLKTSKLNYTQLGGTYPFRPNKGVPTLPPPLNPGWSYLFLYECYLHVMSFPRGCAWCCSSELVSLPHHAPVGVTPSCMNVTYELSEVTSTPLPPTAGESYPSCMNVTYVSPGAAYGVDSSELVAHPLHAPVGVTHSCMNVTYELYELTSTPQPPATGKSYLSCMSVTYGLSISQGALSPTPSPLEELASPV